MCLTIQEKAVNKNFILQKIAITFLNFHLFIRNLKEYHILKIKMSSTSTWEEIKRLAADFQRVQLVESSYK